MQASQQPHLLPTTDGLPAVNPCPRCRGGRETYWYLYGAYLYDVDQARQLVADGREPVELEEESARASVADSELDDNHVPHVDPTVPGIIAHIRYPLDDGEIVTGHVLIDGHHRAARCLREQRPFYAYLLTEEESQAVLLRSPERPAADQQPAAEELPEVAAGCRAYEEKFARSQEVFLRARNVIAGAITHDRRDFGPFPVYVDRAEGVWKWEVSGRPLLDYWMGHGSLLCGHAFPPVVEAVTRQVARGTHPGACHEAEVLWAELVCRLIPSAERVRFTASGTEATLLALRVARAFTGRDRIVAFRYHFHGWHDELMASFYPGQAAGFNAGTLGQVSVVDPLDAAAAVALVEKGDVAAVILEPGGAGAGALPWSRDFLQTLRQATLDHGSLLIFDEVITGFRNSPGGVQQLCGVLPDLTTLAKILSGGLPGGAVAGRAEIMQAFGSGFPQGERWVRVPHTGTFNGNPLSAAAGIALLEHVADGVAQQQARAAAERLVGLVNAAAEAHRVDVRLYTDGGSIYHILIGSVAAGVACGPSLDFVRLHAAHRECDVLLRRALLVEGLDTNPVHGWVSALHGPVVDSTVQAFERAFHSLRNVPGFRL